MAELPPPAARLAELRARIDAADAALLSALARRHAVVAEIAAWKRAHGAPLRDPLREAALMRARAEAGRALGLPERAVTAVFRVVLQHSRALLAELCSLSTSDEPARTLVVLGAPKPLAGIAARMFSRPEDTVQTADSWRHAAALTATADVVLLATAADDAVAAARELSASMGAAGALIVLAEQLAPPIDAALEAGPASVLGVHPHFDTRDATLSSQRVTLCPGRGVTLAAWARGVLEARGLVVRVMEPAAHDRAMMDAPALFRAAAYATALTLARANVSHEQASSLLSPWSRAALLASAGELATETPPARDALRALGDAAEMLARALENPDEAAATTLCGIARAHVARWTTAGDALIEALAVSEDRSV